MRDLSLFRLSELVLTTNFTCVSLEFSSSAATCRLSSALTRQQQSHRRATCDKRPQLRNYCRCELKRNFWSHLNPLFSPFLGVLVIVWWKCHSWWSLWRLLLLLQTKKFCLKTLNSIYLSLPCWNSTKTQPPSCCYDPALLTCPANETHKPAHGS